MECYGWCVGMLRLGDTHILSFLVIEMTCWLDIVMATLHSVNILLTAAGFL